MLKILAPSVEDSIHINNLIKDSWLKTYVNSEVGVTTEDVLDLYNTYTEEQIKALDKRVTNPTEDDISFVAKENDELLGYIRYKIFPDEIELRTFYIRPDRTGQGIGTKLWQESIKHLPENKIIFTEPVEHTRAINFYKKIGFIDSGEKYLAPDELPSSGIKLPLIKMIYRR